VDKPRPGKRWNENELLLDRIQEIYQKNRRVYGSPRITEELREQGTLCGKNRIARIMKENGIRAEVKRGSGKPQIHGITTLWPPIV
jgi:transposase InsO family protein